ncbi:MULTISPECIES: MBL fold metallo-hydrolase [Sphingobacterium]|uniref:MBL fold metallo-hydrolase n=1 Tax=Sphingobacterium TaxID=28453 RepID=UPI002579782D|nr:MULTISPECIES: MBL fold metallo-hydrolase [Sphingobacterium]
MLKANILLDTGLGFTQNSEPLIYKSLAKENVLPTQITKILISHLHKDHIGGIGHFKNNSFRVNFPNASIYIQNRELDFALTQWDNPSYNYKIVKELARLTNVIRLNDNFGKITDEITYEVSGGHTPYH